ncbi:circadian clock KaiB family protein [Oleisolibacter albus]|uniref:circadian clock KaiB family protein n=1 Tax=Oleisolibacter albus TaxID=2171757 RepID=UPI001EFD17B5|nr:circadian clock KaiB family protein [Oleisolibacter albus]
MTGSKKPSDFGAGPASQPEDYVLRLYVTGTTPRSMRAIENIRRICRDHLGDRYRLEVVDVYQQPHLASQAQVVAAPTLVKELPSPLRKLVGDLSDQDRVLAGLDIRTR